MSFVLKSPTDDDTVKATEGTYHFMSPEQCDPDCSGFGAKQVDVWALGVTMFCMLFNRTPFWGETEYQIMESIRLEPLVIPGSEVRTITKETRELLQGLLQKDPKKRITVNELSCNSWLMA